MNNIRKSIVHQLHRPNAVPFSIEFRPLRFVEINGEVSVERVRKRRRLTSTSRQHLFCDHRIKNVRNGNTCGAKKLKIELSIMKNFDDPIIRKNPGKRPNHDSFAQWQQKIELAVRELDRKQSSEFGAQARSFGVAAKNFGLRQPFRGVPYFIDRSSNKNIHRLDSNRLNRKAEIYYPYIRTDRNVMPTIIDETEARILGSLVEKQLTTPEYYPLTLNALATACNQKSNRDPIMLLDESGILAAIDMLRDKNLVYLFYGSGSRTVKYKHMLPNVYELRPPAVALIALLLLRGPQTAGEMRGRSDRLYPFGSIAEVQETLDELAGRGEPLVVRLERQPGQKESRYAHLLSGEVEAAAFAERPQVRATNPHSSGRIDALEQELSDLKNKFDDLREDFNRFKEQFS